MEIISFMVNFCLLFQYFDKTGTQRMKDEILNIINDILTTNEKPSLDKIDGDASLTDDIGLDSLDLAQLTVMVEDKYGIDIFEDQIITHVKQIFDKISH